LLYSKPKRVIKMKNLLYLLLFIPIMSFSQIDMMEVKHTLSSIKSSEKLRFYTEDKAIKLQPPLKFSTFEKSDIVLFPSNDINDTRMDKMMIVGSYQELKLNKKNIGAIYLKKGRTHIVFIEERLKENDLSLPKKFDKYIINECMLNPICLLKL